MGLQTRDITGFSPTGALGDFASPWRTAAAAAMPTQYKDALQMAEFAWNADGTYRTAQERLVAYFLTDVEFESVDQDNPIGDDDKDRWRQMLYGPLAIDKQIIQGGIDRSCYGNQYASLIVPFKRFLVSPTDGTHYEFSRMASDSESQLEYRSHDNSFYAVCPKLKQKIKFRIQDLPDDFSRKLSVKWWSPHEIEVIFDPWSHTCEYVWKIPDDYRRDVIRGNMHVLEHAPMKVLEAVSSNKWFKFAPGALYHGKEMAVSGLKLRGVGLSRVLLNFRDIWHVQLLRCFNEAIAMDYVIPLRLITPEAAAAQPENPTSLMPMGGVGAQIRGMLNKRRQDPMAWHTLPFPVRYTVVGGDAKELVPHELLEFEQDSLLNAANVPAQLYRSNLEMSVAPVALRQFESSNVSTVRNNNDFLDWLIQAVGDIISMPTTKAKFARVTHADDFNRQMANLQLFMGRQLSGGTAFGGMGLDYRSEQRQIAEEARYGAKLQADMQEEMDQTAFGEQIAKGQTGAPGQPPGAPGAAPPAGAPADPAAAGGAAGGGAAMPGGPGSALQSVQPSGVPVSIDEMMMQADAVAQELLGIPSSQRISELRALKQKNEPLHHLVTAKLDDMRSQAASAGQQMLLGGQ